jgi:hypothetical protein
MWRCCLSAALSGLVIIVLETHGSRRGLYSFCRFAAANRCSDFFYDMPSFRKNQLKCPLWQQSGNGARSRMPSAKS